MIAAPPPAALSVSPSRLELAAAASGTVELRNAGATTIVVSAGAGSYARDAAGRARILGGGGGVRLVVRPSTVAVPAGGRAVVAVAALARPGARPGDHAELLLLATRGRTHGGVGVRLRVGVPVVVRIPGRAVHRLVVGRPALRRAHGRWAIRLELRNDGDLVERVSPATLQALLVRRGRVLARLRVPARELLPGGRARLLVGWPRRLRGRLTLLIRSAAGTPRRWPMRLP